MARGAVREAGIATFNEMFDGDRVRPAYERLLHWVQNTSPEVLAQKKEEAEALFRRIGITFAVYGEGGDTERLIPFDMMPRVFTEAEWRRLERGVKQRARALNRFLYDVYHRAEIVRAGVIPADLVFRNEAYEPAVVGIDPPGGVYSHIVGIDLVRTGADEFFVLEDNCRTPSGVSYMLENREIMMRMFPELFRASRIEPVDDYPDRLRRTLASVAPPKCEGEPVSVMLSPGSFNSAYYEHSFLADQMGIELVEGQDLFVQGDFVYMRTTEGPKRVDVIYRRIDDSFLDPLCFRPELDARRARADERLPLGRRHDLLGARGRGRRRQGGLYLRAGDDPLLPRRAPDPEERADLEVRRPRRPASTCSRTSRTWWSRRCTARAATGCSSGRSRPRSRSRPMPSGSRPTRRTSSPSRRWRSRPARPSRARTALAPRHVDLRPFCLVGREVHLCPGGLTRVALKEGSLVVNSSQGGGVKDTWVLAD